MTTSAVTLNAEQEASLAKAEKINSCCETYKTDVVKVQSFSNLSITLAATIPKINIAERIRTANRDTKAITEEKNQKLEALIIKADGLGTALRASDDFKDSESDAHLQKMYKGKLRQTSQDLAMDNMANFFTFLAKADAKILAKDAITSEEIAELQAEYAEIRNFSKRKETTGKQKSENQAALIALFDELNTTIDNMINLSSRFASTAPNFYAALNKIITFKSKAMLQKAEKAKVARLKNKKKPLADINLEEKDSETPV